MVAGSSPGDCGSGWAPGTAYHFSSPTLLEVLAWQSVEDGRLGETPGRSVRGAAWRKWLSTSLRWLQPGTDSTGLRAAW